MLSEVLQIATEGGRGRGRRVISLIVAVCLMLLFATGIGGFYSGKWIMFVEGGSISGGGGIGSGRNGISLVGGGGFWSSAMPPSNVGIAIAVTAMAGLALAVTVVYSRRGSLKSPWPQRRRKHALMSKQWKSSFLPDGKLCDGGVKFLKKVRSGGVDPTIRAEVWPFLLGVYDVNSSKEERESIRSLNRKEYGNLRKQCRKIIRCLEKNSGSKDNKTKSLSEENFAAWRRIIRLDAVRANSEWIIYSPSHASITELNARHFAKSVGLKDYGQLEPCRVFHAARLVSILEAYALRDPEIGYCQGMSDLLSPIISVIDDDSEAFWCFVGFMKKARHNFRLDEVGIRRQLNLVSRIIKYKDSHLYGHLEKLQAEDCFFVYRMVVVLFRRELNFDQTLCLWEVIWADQAAIRAGIALSSWGRMRPLAPPNEDLLLYAIAASVLQRRKLIIEEYSSMEEIMKDCNSMAGHLDVWKLLDDAHDLVVNLNDKI
ncbi:hypothetical protein SAY87_014533 [Trapa incisa]|uniref:Rab-GAP TBC domain-containing protein n=1 Tax=Trapa incisa TaxID=236973 RepID=A0AAN7GWA3_9MYRT|nr:hypothetical protein SAY87_014533 [Trapa incisa]